MLETPDLDTVLDSVIIGQHNIKVAGLWVELRYNLIEP